MFVSRIDPVDVACAPNLASFEAVCVPAIETKFKSFPSDVTWKVVYEKHGESNLTREKAIELAESVIEDRHEVSIHNPDIVIKIHIFQSMCGMGFLRDYDNLCEYNIRKLVTSKIKQQ
jgi:tRNA(Ser,Leu) C12 N-acetylase TAN1